MEHTVASFEHSSAGITVLIESIDDREPYVSDGPRSYVPDGYGDVVPEGDFENDYKRVVEISGGCPAKMVENFRRAVRTIPCRGEFCTGSPDKGAGPRSTAILVSLNATSMGDDNCRVSMVVGILEPAVDTARRRLAGSKMFTRGIAPRTMSKRVQRPPASLKERADRGIKRAGLSAGLIAAAMIPSGAVVRDARVAALVIAAWLTKTRNLNAKDAFNMGIAYLTHHGKTIGVRNEMTGEPEWVADTLRMAADHLTVPGDGE